VLIRKGEDTNGIMKSKLKKVSNAVSNVIPEVEIKGITTQPLCTGSAEVV
jgi:hypothetical protein